MATTTMAAVAIAAALGGAACADTCLRIGRQGARPVEAAGPADPMRAAAWAFLAGRGLDPANVARRVDYGFTRFYAYETGWKDFTVSATRTATGIEVRALPAEPAAAVVVTGRLSSFVYAEDGSGGAIRIGQNEPREGAGSAIAVPRDALPAAVEACFAALRGGAVAR